MFTLIGKLYRTRLLTIFGLLHLLEAVMTTGVNLMALLRIAAKLHPGRLAVIDEEGQLSYTELWQQAETLAIALHVDHGVRADKKWRLPAGIMRLPSKPFLLYRDWAHMSFFSTPR